MNHTSSHHLSAKKSGLLSSQSTLVGWLEDHIQLLFPAESEPQAAKRGKPATLTLPHLCLALFVGVFCGATGFRDIWRWLAAESLGTFPKLTITDDAVRKAVARWGPQTFANLYIHLCDALPKIKISETTTLLATFATEIVALDESTLDAIHRHCKQVRHLACDGNALRGLAKLLGCGTFVDSAGFACNSGPMLLLIVPMTSSHCSKTCPLAA